LRAPSPCCLRKGPFAGDQPHPDNFRLSLSYNDLSLTLPPFFTFVFLFPLHESATIHHLPSLSLHFLMWPVSPSSFPFRPPPLGSSADLAFSPRHFPFSETAPVFLPPVFPPPTLTLSSHWSPSSPSDVGLDGLNSLSPRQLTKCFLRIRTLFSEGPSSNTARSVCNLDLFLPPVLNFPFFSSAQRPPSLPWSPRLHATWTCCSPPYAATLFPQTRSRVSLQFPRAFPPPIQRVCVPPQVFTIPLLAPPPAFAACNPFIPRLSHETFPRISLLIIFPLRR